VRRILAAAAAATTLMLIIGAHRPDTRSQAPSPPPPTSSRSTAERGTSVATQVPPAAVGEQSEPPQARGGRAAANGSAGDAPPRGVPDSGTALARREWEPVVQGFAISFPNNAELSSAAWLHDLRPFVTSRLAADLGTVDLSRLPAGHYAGYQLISATGTRIVAVAAYQEGWSLLLRLIDDGHGPAGYRIYSCTAYRQ
jgi:hypothetical protein